jgi:hypothetical protein
MVAALGVLLERLPGLELTEALRFVRGSIRGSDAVRVHFQLAGP